jgi:invasion protein IalB
MLSTNSIAAALAAFATAVLSISPSVAQETGLPGNASNLREGHDDWQVACTAPEGSVRCAMSQTQVRGETRQRVLSIELTTGNDRDAANGVLVLPFGLDLASGVAYRLDDDQTGAVQPFRTCLAVGCLVDVAFDASTVASLRAGNQLDVIATADGGQETVFSISLTGFSSAHDRVRDLLEP